MNIRSLTPNVAVSDQLVPADIAELKAQGFKAIVCNRPDGEADGQPAWSAIEGVARAAGLETAYIPVVPGQVSDEQALEFREVVTGLPKPVVAFCRTGTRAAQLWALAARDRLSTEEVIRTTAAAGYDL